MLRWGFISCCGWLMLNYFYKLTQIMCIYHKCTIKSTRRNRLNDRSLMDSFRRMSANLSICLFVVISISPSVRLSMTQLYAAMTVPSHGHTSRITGSRVAGGFSTQRDSNVECFVFLLQMAINAALIKLSLQIKSNMRGEIFVFVTMDVHVHRFIQINFAVRDVLGHTLFHLITRVHLAMIRSKSNDKII